MKWRKIIFIFVAIVSVIAGISSIVLSSYNMSLSPPYLGYGGGMVLIVVPIVLWGWELSHKPKVVKRK